MGEMFKVIGGLAIKIQKANTTKVGFGVATAPLTCEPEHLWKAMQFVTRDPATGGQGVDTVEIQHKSGFMVRSMRVISSNKVIFFLLFLLLFFLLLFLLLLLLLL